MDHSQLQTNGGTKQSYKKNILTHIHWGESYFVSMRYIYYIHVYFAY